MSEYENLPGRLAEGLAQRIERRRFFRRSGRSIFMLTAALAAGEGLQILTAGNAFACDCNDSSCEKGLGCPTGGTYGHHPCGPSPCCSALKKSCHCGKPHGVCKEHVDDCVRKGTNVYSSHCWSCSITQHCGGKGCECRFTTTCCDCMVKPSCKPTGYTGYWENRCINWYQTRGGPFCP
jgi:hypothetical protein